MPSLYIVATPIGNLEDITLRALRVLREVKLIAAEDTRKTKRLLNHYNISTPMTSFYEYSKPAKMEYVLDFLQEGDVALVSEAGTPGVSDPGYELIVAAQQRGISIVPVPGPSAVITALVVSGLPTDRFNYIGFLPNKAAARRKLLESMAEEPGTIIALEAPHRFTAAMRDIMTVLGDRQVAICREMTKLHEEVFRGTVSESLAHFTAPRGEFTIAIEGRKEKAKPELTGDIEKRLAKLQRAGTPAKAAIAAVAEQSGLSKKELYKTWLRLDKSWEHARCASPGLERS
ncbi:MAG: 16S rRNA (cytidine(1402)-2'-O)-methyltransferase [Dehalococcoidales bacterium]|nr:16S rRNA (cytidine(1402)-2'-O)-methyltransferase [Dehalococcoidales bacterium]